MRRIIVTRAEIVQELKREVEWLECHTRPKDEADQYETEEAWQAIDWLLGRLGPAPALNVEEWA